jgi:hypothetical protein
MGQTLKKRNQLNNNTRRSNSIVRRLNPISFEKIQTEFKELQSLSCTQLKNISSRKALGNNIVDFFTLKERLHTKGHQNVSFYDFWKKRNDYKKKPYVKKMLDFYENRNIDEIRKYKYIYNLYFSSIAIFKPLISMDIFCRTKATRVLDFTMGWGGRLVGACARNIEAYYGIDKNHHLEKPYFNMKKAIQDLDNVNTEIHLLFQDALEVDYSKMNYDTVLTSPPYYDIEVYRSNTNTLYKTKEEWNIKFYKPLFQKTFTHLREGGHYCLNVPEEIYKDCCIPILGKCSFKILLKKEDRQIESKKKRYKEYIYVWKKN